MIYLHNSESDVDGFVIKEAYPYQIKLDADVWTLEVDNTDKHYKSWIRLNDELLEWLKANANELDWRWWVEKNSYLIGFKTKEMALRFKLSMINKNV